jgi:hypothetical protein
VKRVYLHLGQEVVVKIDTIVGIFDLEKSSLSKDTKNFFNQATKHNQVITVSYEMPKSFVVCQEGNETKVYISQISCATLKKRATQAKQRFIINE